MAKLRISNEGLLATPPNSDRGKTAAPQREPPRSSSSTVRGAQGPSGKDSWPESHLLHLKGLLCSSVPVGAHT